MKGRICPRCESFNVRTKVSDSSFIMPAGLWECLDCGFSSVLFPELEMDDDKNKENEK